MNGMNATTGKRIAGLDHIQQNISRILTTPLGSLVMRRDFGSLLPELVDQPLHGATLLRVYAASVDAILRFEPRVQVQSIQLDSDADGRLEAELELVGNTGQRLHIPLGLQGVVA